MWYYSDEYGSYSVQSRLDLALPQNQFVIARAAREGKKCRCRCRDDIALWLIPVERDGPKYFLRRSRISDPHRPGCIAQTLEPIFPAGEVVYTDNIIDFEIAGPRVARFSGDTPSGSPSGAQYGDLVHLLQAQFAKAQIEMLAHANGGKSCRDSSLANPGREKVLQSLHRVLSLPLIARGQCSLRQLLEEKELCMIWGVTSQPLVTQTESPFAEDEYLEFKVGAHWSMLGFQNHSALLNITGGVAAASRGNVRARGHIIGPPYFFVAVGNGVQREIDASFLYRVPVSIAGGGISVVESEAERNCLEILAQAGCVWLKPHVQADLRALGRDLWPFPLDPLSGRLPSRPDVMVFGGGKVLVLYITASTDEEYHSGVDRSVEHLREFLGADVQVLKIEAAKFDLATVCAWFCPEEPGEPGAPAQSRFSPPSEVRLVTQ